MRWLAAWAVYWTGHWLWIASSRLLTVSHHIQGPSDHGPWGPIASQPQKD
jgi:hypothetical protein